MGANCKRHVPPRSLQPTAESKVDDSDEFADGVDSAVVEWLSSLNRIWELLCTSGLGKKADKLDHLRETPAASHGLIWRELNGLTNSILAIGNRPRDERRQFRAALKEALRLTAAMKKWAEEAKSRQATEQQATADAANVVETWRVRQHGQAERAMAAEPAKHSDDIPKERQTKPMSLAEAGTRLGLQPRSGTKGQRREAAAKAIRRLMNKPDGIRYKPLGSKFIFDNTQVRDE